MSLRGRLVSVLLFLGAFMIVPLGFSLYDYSVLKANAETLQSQSYAVDVRLSRSAIRLLTKIVKNLKVYREAPSKVRRRSLEKSYQLFLAHWRAFTSSDPQKALLELREKKVPLNIPPVSDTAWGSILDSIAQHGGQSWSEQTEALTRAFQAAQAKTSRRESVQRFDHFRSVAATFRARLLGIGQGKAGPTGTVFDARIRGTSLLILEELLHAKYAEIQRVACLILVGVFMALFFARVLWRDLIEPLERLRGSINNMAMSGTPTTVDTHGPPEVRDLLKAYNRLVDMIAGEAAQVARETVHCSKCKRQASKEDKYCPSCGFPL